MDQPPKAKKSRVKPAGTVRRGAPAAGQDVTPAVVEPSQQQENVTVEAPTEQTSPPPDTAAPAEDVSGPPSARAMQIAEEMARQEEVDWPVSATKVTSNTSTSDDGQKTVKVTETRYEYEQRDFHSLDPKDYGIDFVEEEFKYEPPARDDDLPDLHRLMASLEDGSSDLHTPSLFTRPEHVSRYKNISSLKMEMEEGDIADYLGQFDRGVQEDVLMVGSIALDEVQDEERRLRDEHIAYQEQEARITRDHQQQVLVREEEAKRRVARELKEKRMIYTRHEDILQQREKLMLARLQKSFRRAENHLVTTLEERKAVVKTFYGDLMLADGHYGGSKGRRWKVDWDKTPQPIQVKLQCMRGVKDKLPGGRYVLMVSLYNRMGGHVMRWSNLKGQQWGGATLPMSHDGHFYNTEIKIDQSVFTVLPAKPGVRPGMVLVFELFLLRGAVVPTDRVVAWGCFPIANGQFDIVEGKFRCPMLRGEMDASIDKHDKIESLMASDLDHWLSNLYFEVVKLPRYLAGQKEYEVELQFSSGMVAHPDRINTGGEEYRDGEAPMAGSIPDIHSSVTDSSLDSSKPRFSDNSSEVSLAKKPIDATEDEKRYVESSETSKSTVSRPLTHYGSRTVHADKKVKMMDDSDNESDYTEDDVYLMKKEQQFYPVRGKPGLFYKKHEHNPVDSYHKKLFSLLPKTPVINKQKRRRKKLTHLENLEQHNFSVRNAMSEKGHMQRDSLEKLHYVQRQLLAELGLSQWRSREFWGMMLMFIIIFFVRIYIHYVSQWLLLQAVQIPINKFEFLPYTVSLNYQNTLLHTREEIGVVLLGPFGNILVFVLLVLLSWILQKIFGGFPDIGSKFVVVFGIQAFLDPFLILIVDCCMQRYKDLGGDNPIADFAKLYWHFDRAEGSGLAGIFITIFLYVFTCFAAGSILYMYFLRLHNNGRMLDIYWRLHGDEEIFFVPYDLELSNQELHYICRKAEQWRGEEGERRKVAVYDYIWEEENVEEQVWDENAVERLRAQHAGKKEVTIHIAVHTLHLDGLRELYRHFLVLPDGAICEVFGDMTAAGMDRSVKEAFQSGATNLETIATDSQVNLRKGPQLADSVTTLSDAAGSLSDKKHL